PLRRRRPARRVRVAGARRHPVGRRRPDRVRRPLRRHPARGVPRLHHVDDLRARTGDPAGGAAPATAVPPGALRAAGAAARVPAGAGGGRRRRRLGAGVALGRGGQRRGRARLRGLRRRAAGRRRRAGRRGGPSRPAAGGPGGGGGGCPVSRHPLPLTSPAGPAGTGRASWHRRAGLLPLAYFAAIVLVGFIHPVLPPWRWLVIHLLLLGAVTNAIVIWSAHFSAAV